MITTRQVVKLEAMVAAVGTIEAGVDWGDGILQAHIVSIIHQ
jgi:hypothetical protein